jgi:adenylate cyclase
MYVHFLAGVVVTKKKLCYDVWAEVVSMATRLEGTSQPGRVHVTKEIFEDHQDSFVFEQAGIVNLKGQEKQTYFILREKSILDKE